MVNELTSCEFENRCSQPRTFQDTMQGERVETERSFSFVRWIQNWHLKSMSTNPLGTQPLIPKMVPQFSF